MPRIRHFEITAKDVDRAIQFYRDVFGWEIQKWDGPHEYWMVKTGQDDEPGINGGLFKSEELTGIISVLEVPSVDDITNRVVESGGTVTVPKMEVTGAGYIAYYRDGEGNQFGAFEMVSPPPE